jgi:type IV secretion system protein TrbG
MIVVYRVLFLLMLMSVACASESPFPARTPLVAARRVAPPAPLLPSLPPTIAIAEQTLVPGVYTPLDMHRRLPAKRAAATRAPSTYDVIAQANRTAANAPTADSYFNAIQEYVFTPGMLYQVYSATMHATDIALQPGEQHVGPLVTGDNVRWVLAVTKSAEHGVEQEHVVVKPTQPGLSTNLFINTNRRAYYLDLHSYKDETYMVAVKWRYPQDELAQVVAQADEQQQRARNAIPFDPTMLNNHYALVIEQGEPSWTPTLVFDDGRKTYIHFPLSMRAREVPVLFVVSDGQPQLLNYYPKGEYYVADRLFDQAELRVGQQHQEIVRIERTR